MTRGTTVTFNFVDRSTSKWPCTTRSVKQAKQGGDIGHASVLKGVASCITICYMGLRTFRKWGLLFPLLHIETVLTPLFALVSLEMRKRAGACQFSKWRRNAYTNFRANKTTDWEEHPTRNIEKRERDLQDSSFERQLLVSLWNLSHQLFQKDKFAEWQPRGRNFHSISGSSISMFSTLHEVHQSLFLNTVQRRLSGQWWRNTECLSHRFSFQEANTQNISRI